MKIGYSLLLGEYINSEFINYQDCKNFQIVCPCCKEPVFKVIRDSETKKIHYLSHYEKDKSYNDKCELRVSKITVNEIDDHNNESRNQKLRYFLDILKNAIFENEYDPSDYQKIRKYFNQMNRSKALIKFREIIFDFIRNENSLNEESNVYNLFDDYISDYTEISGSFVKTAFSIQIQKRISFDIWQYLLSAKAKGNFNFLFNHSYLFFISRIELARETRELYDWEKFLHFKMRKLMETSKNKGLQIFSELMEYSISPPFSIENSNLLIKLSSEIAHEMLGTLLRIPYFELIKKGKF